MVVAGDLVLEVAEESSLLLLLFSLLINNPFLIFEEFSILNKCLMHMGSALASSQVCLFNLGGSSGVSTSVDISVGMAVCVCVSFIVSVAM